MHVLHSLPVCCTACQCAAQRTAKNSCVGGWPHLQHRWAHVCRVGAVQRAAPARLQVQNKQRSGKRNFVLSDPSSVCVCARCFAEQDSPPNAAAPVLCMMCGSTHCCWFHISVYVASLLLGVLFIRSEECCVSCNRDSGVAGAGAYAWQLWHVSKKSSPSVCFVSWLPSYLVIWVRVWAVLPIMAPGLASSSGSDGEVNSSR